MRLLFFTIISLSFALSSCVSYKVEKFFSHSDEMKVLPKLIIEPDYENFINLGSAVNLAWNRKPVRVLGNVLVYDSSEDKASIGVFSLNTHIATSGYISNFFASKNYKLKDSYKNSLDNLKVNSDMVWYSYEDHSTRHYSISPLELPEAFEVDDLTFDRLGNDAQKLLEQELQNSLFKLEGDAKGYLRWRVNRVNSSYINTYFYASFLTLFTINFLGFPIGYQTAEIELQIDILDTTKTPIATYTSVGHYTSKGNGSAYSAMYWGYSPSGAGNVAPWITLTRVTNMEAFSMALQNIKKEIIEDAHRIREALNNPSSTVM